MRAAHRIALLCACLLAPAWAHAVQDCELNGESVNPNHGGTTAGKTGLMRCKDRDSGQPTREQELQGGKFMGLVRYFKDGKLQREYSVNERGNQHGRSRDFAPGGQVLRDSVYDNGSQMGLARSFHANGQLQRIVFYGPREGGSVEQAYAEFNESGQLQALRCGDKPLLAPPADDARWCGFSGGASQLDLFSGKGVLKGRSSYLAGKRVRHETLGEDGKPDYQEELSGSTRTERHFNNAGVKRREIQWLLDGKTSFREREQEFADSGALTRDRRWSAGKPVSDQSYYLNGQPRSKTEYGGEGDAAWLQTTEFFDSGKTASTGRFSASNRYRQLPLGTHQRFNEAGKLVAESSYDERGRITREKSWDDEGKLLRDDSVFEDGSRKAYSR
ncbi:toxin-antitoxin system YwqK family antitoxin [Polaromonas sp. LjRoot131]|uniref:toxin-antitoxin system YwqK family antitoxin n=1 Tax=Polaromonas sp. LjRoot131 TaxID=3342262 RepID=UPI003ECD31FC